MGNYNASLGYKAANTYLKTFVPRVAEQLNKMSKSYRFSCRPFRLLADIDDDVLAMSSICPFQINALGYSPFCDIFTKKEWRDFNYARDLSTYYESG